MKSDVAVVGAGIVGLATSYALRERGATVRTFESGVPGNGQSGGEARIFRHAHDDERLVRMAKRSRGIWDEWSEALGAEFVSTDGVVALGDSALERLKTIDRVGGIDASNPAAGELAERVPILADYEGPAVVDRDGGSIRTSAAIEALSSELGDRLAHDEVISLRPTRNGTVELRSGGCSEEFGAVVVCAGRGTAPLARTVGLSIPTDLNAHMRITFRLAGQPPENLAALQDSSGEFPETGIYAAAEPGNRRFAVGLSETIAVAEDGSVVDPDSLESLTGRTVAYVQRALPGLNPEPTEFRHCWVTELPWSEDGIGVWERDGIHFVAGHNLYKMAPALGRELASAVVGEGLAEELRPDAKLGEPAR